MADALLAWYHPDAREMPWRLTHDPYAIWVSEIMLQQTRVDTVIPYYERFLNQFPTVGALARARLDTVLKAWEGLGYYARARHLHDLADVVCQLHELGAPQVGLDDDALVGLCDVMLDAHDIFNRQGSAPTLYQVLLDEAAQRIVWREEV